MNPPGFIRPAAALEIPLPGHSSRISRWFAELLDSEIGAVGLEISTQDEPKPVRHPAGISLPCNRASGKIKATGRALPVALEVIIKLVFVLSRQTANLLRTLS